MPLSVDGSFDAVSEMMRMAARRVELEDMTVDGEGVEKPQFGGSIALCGWTELSHAVLRHGVAFPARCGFLAARCGFWRHGVDKKCLPE